MVEGLIYSGAFDEMGVKRSQLAQVYEQLCARAKIIGKQHASNQMSFFGDILEEETLEVVYPDVPELELNEKLSREKEVLGVYVSGHPFEKYIHAFPDCNFDCSLLDDYVEDEEGNRTYNQLQDGMYITMAGVVSSYRRTTTKRTNAFMAFFNLEDVYGSMPCVCFPTVYEKAKAYISNDKIIKIRGKLDLDLERGMSVIVDEVFEILPEGEKSEKAAQKASETLWLNAGNLSDSAFDELVTVLGNYPGELECKIVRGDKKYKYPAGVNYCRGLLAELYSLLEQKDVKYVERK